MGGSLPPSLVSKIIRPLQDHPEAGDEQPLKQLLRRIAVGPGENNERWPTRC